MQQAIKVQAIVNQDGKLEISLPNVSIGKQVDVIILLPEIIPPTSPTKQPPPVLNILEQADGLRQFKTAQAVAEHIRQERDTWDS